MNDLALAHIAQQADSGFTLSLTLSVHGIVVAGEAMGLEAFLRHVWAMLRGSGRDEQTVLPAYRALEAIFRASHGPPMQYVYLQDVEVFGPEFPGRRYSFWRVSIESVDSWTIGRQRTVPNQRP